MLGFGLIIPDVQVRLKDYGAEGLLLGVVLAAFSLAQFVGAPIAGRLSDRVGRKPVLVAGALLYSASYLIYAFAPSVSMILVSRVVGGLGASKLSAAFAYVADTSAPSERAKAIGLLGVALGMGFIFGPPIGGLLADAGGNLLLGLVSMAVSGLNALLILTLLAEPSREAKADSQASVFGYRQLVAALTISGLGVLLLMFFAYSFGFSNLQATFILLGKEHFGMSKSGTGFVLGYVGVLTAFVQGLLVGPLSRRFGERALARYGMMLVAPSLALLPFATNTAAVYLILAPMSIGAGLAVPAVLALISRSAPGHVQGGLFGITQGLGALARVFGPLVGQTAYAFNFKLPYLIAGGVVLVPLALAWFAISNPKAEQESAAPGPPASN